MQDIRNITCAARNTSSSKKQMRTMAFMDARTEFNPNTQSYEQTDSVCVLPNAASTYFGIKNDQCVLITKDDPNALGSKAIRSVSLEKQTGDKYPHGCAITAKDVILDDLSNSGDYEYLETIANLNKEKQRVISEIDRLNKEIIRKNRYLDALKDGVNVANEEMQAMTDVLKRIQREGYESLLGYLKDQYGTLSTNYNSKVEAFNKKLNSFMTGGSPVQIFSERNQTGKSLTLTLPYSENSKKYLPSELGDLAIQTMSVRLFPGMGIQVMFLHKGSEGHTWHTSTHQNYYQYYNNRMSTDNHNISDGYGYAIKEIIIWREFSLNVAKKTLIRTAPVDKNPMANKYYNMYP